LKRREEKQQRIKEVIKVTDDLIEFFKKKTLTVGKI
jgi:hypothetical protein